MQLATAEGPVSALQEGIAKLFEAHHALVLKTAWRVTGNASDAEDVLQTVFLRLLRRPESEPHLENAEAYLHRAAANAALDIVRARKEHVPAEEILDARQASDEPASDNSRELQDVLRRAIAGLRPPAPEILVLRYFEGYSNKEIARMLGISAVRVAVVVHRGCGKLQKAIARYQGVRR
jgi:RNA polymerase sigma-70 factor, ECF subfamily